MKLGGKGLEETIHLLYRFIGSCNKEFASCVIVLIESILKVLRFKLRFKFVLNFIIYHFYKIKDRMGLIVDVEIH